MEIAQLDELTQVRLQVFKKEKDVHTLHKKSKTTTHNVPKCENCGGFHPKEGKCPAKGKQCNKCHKYNHFSKVCRSSMHMNKFVPQSQNSTNKKQSSSRNQVYQCDVESDNEEYFVIDTVNCANRDDKEEIHVNLKLEGETVNMKVDTGAKCNVITKFLASKISKAQKKPIKVDKRKSVKLIAYGGNSFHTLGTTVLQCQHNEVTTDLLFHVVEKPVKSLLGLQDSLRLKLLTLSPEIHELKTEDAPELRSYAVLFDGGLGKLPVKYKISLTEGAKPVVRAAHKIPVAMTKKI